MEKGMQEFIIRAKRDTLLDEIDKHLDNTYLRSKLTAEQITVLENYKVDLRNWPQSGVDVTQWVEPSTPTVEECGLDFSVTLFKMNMRL